MSKTTSTVFIHVVGWYGMVALLAAYTLVSFNFLPANNLWYQLLNLTGALGLCVITYHMKVWPSFWLNSFWSVVGVISLVQLITR